MDFKSAVEPKCPGAETLLRAAIDIEGETPQSWQRRMRWLAGQDPAYLHELADSCQVLLTYCNLALEKYAREATRGQRP